LRELITQMLKGCGFDVLSADSGKAARAIWRDSRHRIELLLTDIVMPEMTGLELAAILQAERPELKIIFMSGHDLDLKVEGTALIEGVNFMPKPYQIRKLAQAIRERLDQAG